jgi:hypothetical protein
VKNIILGFSHTLPVDAQVKMNFIGVGSSVSDNSGLDAVTVVASAVVNKSGRKINFGGAAIADVSD